MQGKEEGVYEAFESGLIRLNQAADLPEKIFTEGAPEDYVVDGMVGHARRLAVLFVDIKKDLS